MFDHLQQAVQICGGIFRADYIAPIYHAGSSFLDSVTGRRKSLDRIIKSSSPKGKNRNYGGGRNCFKIIYEHGLDQIRPKFRTGPYSKAQIEKIPLVTIDSPHRDKFSDERNAKPVRLLNQAAELGDIPGIGFLIGSEQQGRDDYIRSQRDRIFHASKRNIVSLVIIPVFFYTGVFFHMRFAIMRGPVKTDYTQRRVFS